MKAAVFCFLVLASITAVLASESLVPVEDTSTPTFLTTESQTSFAAEVKGQLQQSTGSSKTSGLEQTVCVDLCVFESGDAELCKTCDAAYGKVLGEMRKLYAAEKTEKVVPSKTSQADQIKAEAAYINQLTKGVKPATTGLDALKALAPKAPSTFLQLAASIKARDTMTSEATAGNPYSPAKKWPRGVLPYTLVATEPKLILAFEKAMNVVTKKTCLQFKHDQLNPAAISVEKSTTGGSFTNGLGKGASKLALHDPGAGTRVDMNTLQHEMGHLIGHMHTHQRSDAGAHAVWNHAGCGGGISTLEGGADANSFGYRFQFMNAAYLSAMAGLYPALGFDADVTDAGAAFSFDSVMMYRYENCLLKPLGANPPAWMEDWNQPHPDWTAYDDAATNIMYGCKKTQITYNGKTFDQYVNLDESMELYQEMIYDKTGLLPSQQKLVKADGTEVTPSSSNRMKPVKNNNIAENDVLTMTKL